MSVSDNGRISNAAGFTMMRPATMDDLPVVRDITGAAYAPYADLLGGPLLSVTEDYVPRIARDEVWVRGDGDEVSALAVFERHADHLSIFSIAVAPTFQRQGWEPNRCPFWMRRRSNADWRRCGSIPMRGWRETSRFIVPSAFKKRVADRTPDRPGWTLVDMAKPAGQMASE